MPHNPANHPQRIAVTYLRTASSQRAGDRAIEWQRQQCREMAEYLGVATITHEYVDIGASGNALKRPGLQMLLSRGCYLRARLSRCTEMGRLARGREPLLAVLHQFGVQETRVALSRTGTVLDEPERWAARVYGLDDEERAR